MKKNTLRLIVATAFAALSNGYVKGFVKGELYKGSLKHICVPGLNCYSCPGALGSCPMGSLQSVLSSPMYKVSLYVFGIIGLFGTLFGRFACGFLCPFGLVQELLNKIPFPYKTKKLPGHKILKYLRYVVLLVFVIVLPMFVTNRFGLGEPWFCEYICPSGILFGSIPLLAANKTLFGRLGVRFIIKLSILTVTILVSIIIYRPFCKYLCPLGAIYGLFNPISLYRYNFDKDKCTSCGACVKACDMNIKVYERINSTECIRCGRCADSCANGAITTSFDELRGRLKKHE